MNEKQVMIATPSLDGTVWLDYMNSYIHSIVLAANKGWSVAIQGMSGNSLINYARAILGQDFMDSDADVLFFIDSDLSWDPEGFVRILESPFDIVAGAYPTKQDGPAKFHVKITGGKYNGTGPLVVDTTKAPSGFIKITRSAMKQMQDAHPELKARFRDREIFMLWDCMIVNGEPLGEDFSFCERWQRIGGKIYIDPDITFSHYGRKHWTGNFLQDVIQKE